MSVWYLELDDEITDAVARLRAAKDDRVVLVVPAGSRIGTGRINFRLLAREAVSRDLRIALVSGDAQVRALAASAGLPTYASVGESERGAAAEGPLSLDAPGAPGEDDADATATITTAPGPGAGVRTAGSRPVRRPRSRRRKAVMTAGVLGLVAVVGGGTLLALYRSVPTATIDLALAPRALGPVPIVLRVSAATPTDPDTGTVQGQLVPVTVRGSAVVTATEQRNLSDRARGNVTFANRGSAPVPVPDLTEVATQDGILFLTQRAIQSIEPGDSATVEVRAARQGDQGNVPAGAITVITDPALAAQLGEGGGVTNPEPTTEGTTAERLYFSMDDYDRAVDQLAADLAARLRHAVPEPHEGVVAYPGTAQQAGVVTVDRDAASVVGGVGPQTTIEGSLQANVLTASSDQLDQVALRMLGAVAAPDSLVPGAHITLGEPAIAPDGVTYEAEGRGVVYGLRVGLDTLREQVRSKTIEEARRILGTYGTATITLSPDFLPALPDDPSRILIRPGPPTPGVTPIASPRPSPSQEPGASISPRPGASGVPGDSASQRPTTSQRPARSPVPRDSASPRPAASPRPGASGAPSRVPASQRPAGRASHAPVTDMPSPAASQVSAG